MMAGMREKNVKMYAHGSDGLKNAAPKTEPPRIVKKRGTILLVDDDKATLKLLENIVRNAGHNLTVAQDGKEALKIFRRGGIDLIITDIRMPKMDGIDLLRQIKKEKPETKVIVVTALSPNTIDINEFRNAGAEGILFKPFKSKELREMVEKAVGW